MSMNHPLYGKRIVITRPESQAQPFIDSLREVGAVPIIFPTIKIAPIENDTILQAALQHMDEYDWIVFTSANGVHLSIDSMKLIDVPLLRLKKRQIAVIGPATAAALAHYGIEAALQPEEYIAEAIVDSLLKREPITGKKFLLLRADIARETLHEELEKHGGIVDEIPVYSTIPGEPSPEAFAELRTGVDVITFTSSSTVKYFFKILGEEAEKFKRGVVIACIGPITAKTARDYGLDVTLVAKKYTIPGLMETLTEALET